MTATLRLFGNFNNFLKISTYSGILRQLSTSHTLNLKEIRETQNGKEVIVEGVYVESPRAKYIVQHAQGKCSLCALGLEVKHTDVLILSQFLRTDGCMLPKRVTGLCAKQQKRVSILVAMAQKAGLMPNYNPASSKRDPTLRYGYKKYNKYFDESTIMIKRKK